MVGNVIHGNVKWEEEEQNTEQMTIPTYKLHSLLGFVFSFLFFNSINFIFLEHFYIHSKTEQKIPSSYLPSIPAQAQSRDPMINSRHQNDTRYNR